MFWKQNPEETTLNKLITKLELELETTSDPKEYAKKVKNLEKLYTLKSKFARKGVSSDTVLIVAGNLAGILIIVLYEHSHVIASKAVGQLGKLR